MNKNYRGPAETVKQEKKDLKKDMEGGMKNAGDVPGKKGGAKYKKGAGDYDVKKGSHGHPHGAAQELTAREKILQYGKDVAREKSIQRGKDLEERNNSFLLDSINLEKQGEGTKAQQMYGTNYGQVGKDNKYLGSMTSREVADSPKMTDEYFDQVVKNYKDSEFYPGAGRMGYTQNFGPARQNSYAKGAAKVAKIMGKGPADHIEGHPKPAEIKLDDVTPSGGVKTSNAKEDLRNIIKSQHEYDKNTTSVSRELAEKDSLKLVIQGQDKKAHELYSLYDGVNTKPYTSSSPIPINPYNKSATNQHVLERIANKKRLREEAKKIQGKRPSLD